LTNEFYALPADFGPIKMCIIYILRFTFAFCQDAAGHLDGLTLAA